MQNERRASWLRVFALLTVLGAALAPLAGGTPPAPGAPGALALDRAHREPRLDLPHVPGDLIVRFRPGTSAFDHDAALVRLGGRVAHVFRSGAELWRLGGGHGEAEGLNDLGSNPIVDYVEPNYVVGIDAVPNDPRYGELWGLHNAGQTGGTPGADIEAEGAWDTATGSSQVLVGVIDTGIDFSHPDLAPQWWTNPGEIPSNGVDDDGNGYVDDVHGWDFVNDDNDPYDDHGHGTHVAGTIGAVANNGLGVAGVSWNVSLVALKFLAYDGYGTTAAAIEAVEYATALGVSITNNSWGGGGYSAALYDAIVAAGDAGSLFVAAAGNASSDTDVYTNYPSCYDAANIVSVAATDANDRLASFSNYGRVTVDLGAPGVGVLSTLPGGGYGQKSGTSMATPHVVGVAALVRGIAPAMDVASLKDRLLSTAEPIAALAGITVTGGRLNAMRAVEGPDGVAPDPIADIVATSAGPTSIALTWTATGDDGPVGRAAVYELRRSPNPIDEASFSQALRVPGTPVPAASGSPEAFTVTGLTPQTTYHFAIRALDEWGNAGSIVGSSSATTAPGQPDIEVAGEIFSVTSSQDYAVNAASTFHRFTTVTPPAAGGRIVLDADGDYGSPYETATLDAEGQLLGSAGGAGDCFTSSATFELDAARLAGLLADGRLDVQVRNTYDVDVFCSVNRHRVTLEYRGGADPLDFGSPFVGASVTRRFSVENVGTEDLHLTAVVPDRAEYVATPQIATIPPSSHVAIDVTFTAGAAGPANGVLTVFSDDPDEPERTVPVAAVGLDPPDVTVDPVEVSESLLSNETSVRTLAVANVGASDLTFEAFVRAPAPAEASGPAFSTSADEKTRPRGSDERDPFLPNAIPRDYVARTTPETTTAGATILLVQDVAPWSTQSNENVLALNGLAYDRATSSSLPSLNLDNYAHIIVAGDQPSSTYQRLGGESDRLADWVHRGNVLEVHGAGWGWSGGDASLFRLPAGVRLAYDVDGVNHALLPSHPLLNGVADPMVTSGASLGRIENLPAGATCVAANSRNQVTLAVYAHGRGRVVVTSQPIEHAYYYGTATGPILLNMIPFAHEARADWLTLSPTSGTVAAGGSSSVELAFDATALFGGDYAAEAVIRSNDPDEPEVVVPVNLHVTGTPDITLLGQEIAAESEIAYNAYSAVTLHVFAMPIAPAGAGRVVLTADGDFGDSSERATASAEGHVIGEVGANGYDCSTATGAFTIDASTMEALAADGTTTIRMANTSSVDLFCSVNRHRVRFEYRGSADSLDFGSFFVGLSRTRTVSVRNDGTDTLEISSITVDDPAFVPSASTGSVAPGESMDVAIAFTPQTAGSYASALHVLSNDTDEPDVVVELRGEGLVPPDISVTPAELTSALYTGQTQTAPLTISNDGGSDLRWSLAVTDGTRGTVLASWIAPPAPATAPAVKDELSEPPPDPPASSIVRNAPTGGVQAAGNDADPALEDVLARLDAGYASLNGLVPNRHDFSEGETGSSIGDGGSDMYDGGNYLSTNLGNLAYSNGTIVASAALGGGRYFTRKYPGLFVFAADLANVDQFTISGDLGADGYGRVDGALLEVIGRGPVYRGFLKRVHSAGVPSVNHLIVVVDNPLASDMYSSNANDDFHRVLGLSTSSRLYDLLFASRSGGFVSDAEALEIFRAFVRLLGPTWLTTGTDSGTVAAGASAAVDITFDARGLDGGSYDAEIRIASNDPDEPVVQVPTRMVVTGVPDIAVIGERRSVSSSQVFTTYDATTVHVFPADPVSPADARITVRIEGYFDTSTRTAAVRADGLDLGTIGGGYCQVSTRAFAVDPATFDAMSGDGSIRVEVDNAPTVSPYYCYVNRHDVTLDYTPPADHVDFGSFFVGLRRTRRLIVRNDGTDALHVDAISVDAPSITVSSSSLTVLPRASAEIVLTFAPTEPGTVAANLSLHSDDPDESLLSIPVEGTGLLAPDVTLNPASLRADLLSGRTAAVSLAVGNAGGSPLEWSASIESAIAIGLTAATGDVTSYAGIDPGPADPDAGPTRPGPDQTYTWSPPATGADAAAVTPPPRLEAVLAGLDRRAARIAAQVPARFDFSDGEIGYVIRSGGRGMYENGNYIGTDHGSYLTYTQGVIAPSYAFGPAGRYFTKKYPGLWVLAADLDGVDSFWIDGYLGSWRNGSVDAEVLDATVGDVRYRAFVKRVWGAGTVPSVNHVIVAEYDPALRHSFSTYPGYDYDVVSGLRQTHRLYYLLYSAENGGYVDDTATRSVLTAFLRSLKPDWADVTPQDGSLPAGGVIDLTVGLDASGRDGGDYVADVVIESNDPDTPEARVPLTLHVTGVPDVVVLGWKSISSTIGFNYWGWTHHVFDLAGRTPRGPANVDLLASGDYGDPYEMATLSMEATTLGSVGAAGNDCTDAAGSFVVDAARFRAAAADGRVEIDVANSNWVDLHCATNQHKVTLSWRDTAGEVDFGSLFTGLTVSRQIEIANDGSETLIVSGIAADGGDFTASPTSVSIPKHNSATVTLTFAPAVAGVQASTLRISSDDPDTPEVTVALRGEGLVPPDIVLDPEILETVLETGRSVHVPLTVRNDGGSDLEWSLRPRTVSVVSLVHRTEPLTGSSPYPDSRRDAVPPAPDPSDLVAWVSPDAPSAEIARPPSTSLEDLAVLLDEAAPRLADEVPDRYDFLEGESGDRIVDGGSNMYDVGNFLSTSGGAALVYTQGAVATAPGTLGPQGRYFTKKYPGLFVLAADLDGRPDFTVSGYLGYEQNRLVDGAVLKAQAGGVFYRAFVKRTYGGSIPSVNHMIVVEDAPSASAEFSRWSDDDYHRAYGFQGRTRVYYLLYASRHGGYIDDTQSGRIFESFLAALQPDWLRVVATGGIVPPGGETAVDVELDAAALEGGDFEAALDVISNDPDESSLTVPVRLHVVGVPNIALRGPTTTMESLQTYQTVGAVTSHGFHIDAGSTGAAHVRVVAEGDFGADGHTATVTADGYRIGILGAAGGGCGSVEATFTIPAARFAQIAPDGVVQIRVENALEVSATCPTNRHRVALSIRPDVYDLDFGTTFVGFSTTQRFTVENIGVEPLNVSSVAVTSPPFEAVPQAVVVPKKGFHEIAVTFAPTARGTFDHVLRVASDDPDTPEATLQVRAVAVIPPDIDVAPASISRTLLLGESSVDPISVSNTAADAIDLTWNVTIDRVTGAGVLASSGPQHFEGTLPATPSDGTTPPPDPPPGAILTQSLPDTGADSAPSGAPHTPLEDVLALLDTGFSQITGAIPNVFAFAGGETGTFIHDDGGHMYDAGNLLITNYGGPFQYSDGIIRDALILGPTGRYFTRKYPGLWLFAADIDGLSEFTIVGDLGIDGDGRADGTTLGLTVEGRTWRAFVKRVWGTLIPSVNHMILVDDNPDARQSFSTYTNDDYHTVTPLYSSRRLYYLLFAGSRGTYIDNAAMQGIAEAFLGLEAASWVTVSPPLGATPAQTTSEATLTLNAERTSPGVYDARIELRSNDPDEPAVAIPARLEAVRLIADAGPGAVVECTGNDAGPVSLDGGASRHFQGSGAIVRYAWTDEDAPLGDGSPLAASLGVGRHEVGLRVEDATGAWSTDTSSWEVVDTVAPSGGITGPPVGTCFGPASLPVVVSDDASDVCTSRLTRTYSLPEGAVYAAHGDWDVRLVVSDPSGNAGPETATAFTIDTTTPRAEFLVVPDRWTFPSFVPFATFFADTDDDGATGDVVHERIIVDGCTVYDGATYGDGDGLLLDEGVDVSEDTLCRMVRMCGRRTWVNPVVEVEMRDCGGNVTTIRMVDDDSVEATEERCPSTP